MRTEEFEKRINEQLEKALECHPNARRDVLTFI